MARGALSSIAAGAGGVSPDDSPGEVSAGPRNDAFVSRRGIPESMSPGADVSSSVVGVVGVTATTAGRIFGCRACVVTGVGVPIAG